MGTRTADFGLWRIGQIAVNVQDLQRATAFYRDVLGIRLLFEVPGMAFFDCGEVRLMLGKAEQPEFDHRASIIYYRVDDMAAAYQRLVERDVEFVHEPRMVHKTDESELWMAFLRDSEENVLALMSEVPVV